jgi:hypothetical protein
VSRLASHPERLSNVYFNAVLLLRAVARAAPYLEAYDIGTGAPAPRTLDSKHTQQCSQDVEAKSTLDEVLSLARSNGMQRAFDENDFFTGHDAGVSLAASALASADGSCSRSSSRRISGTCRESWTV